MPVCQFVQKSCRRTSQASDSFGSNAHLIMIAMHNHSPLCSSKHHSIVNNYSHLKTLQPPTSFAVGRGFMCVPCKGVAVSNQSIAVSLKPDLCQTHSSR